MNESTGEVLAVIDVEKVPNAPFDETKTHIFVKVDLPRVDKVAAILHERQLEIERKYQDIQPSIPLNLTPWAEMREAGKDIYRKYVHDFYAALEEAWEEEA